METATAVLVLTLAAALSAGLLWIGHLRKRIARMDILLQRDALTGLPNHLLARDRLDRLIAYAGRNETKVAVVAVDVDDFKTVNESMGYRAGDALLRDISVRLTDAVRDSDTVSRHGGDEFLVLLREVRDVEATTNVAAKMLEVLAAPFQCGDLEAVVTASMGIAIYPDDGGDFDTLVRKANTALFHAKRGGKNTFRFFAERMNADSARRLQVVNALRHALDNDEFVLHYQPQFAVGTGQIVGAEALVRWQCPRRGMVPPNDFIPAAEQSGLIVPIGEWVLNEACRQAAQWMARTRSRLSVAVNVSPVQFTRGGIEDKVRAVLARTGLPASCLELEITESVLLQDSDDILASVLRLSELGVTFSIDDFGTGYSSLSYLHRFAVHKLKIDQTFIRDLRNQHGSEAIVRAIIQMADGLGLQTVAEGIEDQWSMDFLKQHQCHFVQGYFLSRPLPPDQFELRLAEQKSVAGQAAQPALPLDIPHLAGAPA